MTINYSDIAFRLFIMILAAATGWLFYPLIVNLLIYWNIMPVDSVNNSFGQTLIQRAVLIWLGSVIVSIGFLFGKTKWRYVLISLPILLPSLFALIYSLTAS